MHSLEGKKLLVLAGNAHMAELVKRAKELGVYTIVTDYNDQYDSPAKRVADEAWNISWADLDLLEQRCRNVGIDGIVAGYSEFTVEKQIQLCRRLNLPCYCDEYQLDVTRNKDLFKRTCRQNGVPVIKEYASAADVSQFPVIVKPVDRGGSIGISVANDPEELEQAVSYAMEMSGSKRIVIEDYISNGIKIDVYYGIIDGKITLLSTSDTINAIGNSGKARFEKVIQNGWVSPSRYHDLIVKQADDNLRKMIEKLGIKYGFIFFSGFAIEKKDGVDFFFFETGFRLSGGHLFNFFHQLGFVNVQDIFIYHALLGNDYVEDIGEKKNNELKAAIVNYYAKSGTVTSIEGIDMIGSMDDCRFLLVTARYGQLCSEEKAILHKLAMFHFYNKSISQLASDIEYANKAFTVLNERGQDFVFERMDPNTVRYWWDS